MKKITIILLHYNQRQYIYKAIDSILMQDYKNIELIINDDCSKDFNADEVKKYIEKNQSGNIKLIINENKKNLGIVKSINKCIKLSTGEYISFFAADDVLNNRFVFSKYCECFEKSPIVDVWCLQCLMYDKKMEKIFYQFIDKKIKKEIENASSKKMFSILCTGCIFAVGATVFRRDVLINKSFNEEYSVIEDWPYYISLAKEKYNIKYYDYVALNHRDGGISHSENNIGLKKYRNDLVQIYKNEIFPHFDKINIFIKFKILDNYKLLLKSCDSSNYDSKGNYNYKITKLIYSIVTSVTKTKNIIYKTSNLLNYLYLLFPCILLDILYKKSIPLEMFFWSISVPILIIVILNLFISIIKKVINKIIYINDERIERK